MLSSDPAQAGHQPLAHEAPVPTSQENLPLHFLTRDPPELLNFLVCNWSLPKNMVHLLVEILLYIFWCCQEIDCPGTHWGRNQDNTGFSKFKPLLTVFSPFASCICNIIFLTQTRVTSVYILYWFHIQCQKQRLNSSVTRDSASLNSLSRAMKSLGSCVGD